jgi:site-specific DNA recombinase
MKIATYTRVSSASQTGEDHYGLARQQADIDAFVLAGGHEVVATFEDAGFSGATIDRPGILALIEAADAGDFEAVIVAAWDRLARDTMLDGYLRYTLAQHGVTVLSATQTNGLDPMTKLTQDILRCVAEFERYVLKQRLLGGRRVKASKGGYAGGRAPYGTFAQSGSKVLHRSESEFEILLDIKAMRDNGSTLQQIADALNAAGRGARNGGIWRPGTVQTALHGYERAAAVA